MSEWRHIQSAQEGDDVLLGRWEWHDGLFGGWVWDVTHMPYYSSDFNDNAQYWKPSGRPEVPPKE